ncbi:IS3 family transposase, partial [Collinsella aerofaciens]|uniref:IS3 family transposase n=1 Tax=Collinsella aerofaciens TaxID=74426 RepID=UPI0034A3E50E
GIGFPHSSAHVRMNVGGVRIKSIIKAFKADLDDFVVHWNTRRRQVKLKGLTPEEFRRQSLAA